MWLRFHIYAGSWVFVFLCLAYFTWHNALQVHPCCLNVRIFFFVFLPLCIFIFIHSSIQWISREKRNRDHPFLLLWVLQYLLKESFCRCVWGTNSNLPSQVKIMKDVYSKSVLPSHSHTSHVTDIQRISSGFDPNIATYYNHKRKKLVMQFLVLGWHLINVSACPFVGLWKRKGGMFEKC